MSSKFLKKKKKKCSDVSSGFLLGQFCIVVTNCIGLHESNCFIKNDLKTVKNKK